MKRFQYLVPVFLFLGWHFLNANSPTSYSLVPRIDLPINITGIAFQDTCTLGLGSVDITVTGGTPPYSYTWSNGANTEDVTGLTGGISYSVTVTDASGATQVMSFFVVNFTDLDFPGSFSNYYSTTFSDNTSCTGQSNAFLELTPLTNLPFTWLWDDGYTLGSRYNIPVGFYHHTVTLGTCEHTFGTSWSNEPDNPVLVGSPTNATCGLPNGSIDLTVTESEPPYTYAWSNGASTEDLAGLPPGTYTVTVTGTNACTATASYTLADVPPFGLSGLASPVSSCLFPNGSIDLEPTPAGSYNFSWSNGAVTEDLTGLSAGTYSVTATDANGCTETGTYIVEQIPITLSGTPAASTSCTAPNGSVDLTVSPSGSYTYAWSNGAATEDLTGLAPGSYSVTVSTGAGGCTATATFTVEDQAMPPTLSAFVTAALCGLANGSIGLTASGGAPTYTFLWSNGSTAEDPAGLAAGSYTVTATGANGCTATATATVPDGTITINITGNASPNTSCSSPNGSVSVSASPPNPSGGGYTFAWPGGSTGQSLAGLSAGSYTVTVSAGSTCSATATFTVTDEPLLPLLSTAAVPASCGGADGAVDLTATGGAPLFTFLWSNGETQEDITGLPAATYTVTAIGANGCTASASTTVPNGNNAPSLSANVSAQTACSPPDGAVQLSVSPPGSYAFVWSNGETAEDITGLAAGSYSVTVTPAGGGGACSSTASYTVSGNLPPPDTTYLSLTTCDPAGAGTFWETQPGQDGCDSVAVTEIAYFPADTTYLTGSTCDPAEAGIFEQTLTNSNGCDSLVITEVALLASDTTYIFGTDCDISQTGIFEELLQNIEGCDSLVITDISYSAADTTYLFDSSCDPSQTGVFEELLQNMEGCDSLVITNISYSESDTTYLFDSSCDPTQTGIFEELLQNMAGCDSLIITDISYSAADTTYLFESSCDPTQTGIFEELLQNMGGCDSLVITDIAYSEADTTYLFDNSCDPTQMGIFEELLQNMEGCDSLVITEISYSAADTTYIFDSSCDPTQVGISEELLQNMEGCDSLVITEISYSAADTTYIFDSSCDPTQTGIFEELLLNVEGCDSLVITDISYSTADTTYLFDTNCDLSQVGVFEELLTNNNGCDSLVITDISYSAADTTYLFDSSCDPTQTGIFEDLLQNIEGCDSLVITDISYAAADTTYLSGTNCDPDQTGIFEETLTNSNGCDSIVITTINLLPSGTVFLSSTTCDPTQSGVFTETFSNQHGCDSTVVTTVILLPSDTVLLSAGTCDPTQAGLITEIFTNQNGCDSTVVTTLNLLPNDTVIIYAETCDPAQAGVFTTIFTNQNGCDSTVVTTVNLLPGDTIFTAAETCDPDNVGTFSQTFSNQNGCDSTVLTTIHLLPGDTTLLLSGSCSPADTGMVANTFSNQWGCDSLVLEIVELLLTPALTIFTSDFNGFGTSCDGVPDGSATVSASGGNGPFNYLWSNGSTGQEIDGLAAGNYAVTVTTADGCTAVAGVTITAPPPMQAAFSVSPLDCFGENDGAVFVQASGGAPPYQFSLNGSAAQPSNAFSGLSAGTYTASIIDANGCEISEILWINAPVPVEVELGDDLFIGLGESTSIHAVVNLPFGQLANVTWTGLDSAECPNCLDQPLAPVLTSAYSVSIVDVNGCGDEDAVTVFVDRRKGIFVPNAFSPNSDGVNDLFRIFAKPGTVKNIRSFLVFGRWGESVWQYYNFQPNDPAHGWNGAHRGNEMGPAVFVWFAEIEFTDGEVGVFEGEVVLVR